MAGNFTATRVHIYLAGAIIYAANHNANENAIFTPHNNAFNASTGHQHTGATGDAPLLNALSLDLADDYDWTGVNTFDEATITALSTNTPGWMSNIGCTLSAGLFKITGAGGVAFNDSDNIGVIALPSNTAGTTIAVQLTEDIYSFNDASSGSSDIVGEAFGTTAGTAWGDIRPFFIYAVNADDTADGVEFAISPRPNATTSPDNAAYIGYHGNPAATPSDIDFFFLTSTDVTATHVNKPCVCIGTITMNKNASDDWTVQALNQNTGIGRFVNLTQEFDFSTQQMGSTVTQSNWVSNGGTPPTFTNNYKRYKVNMDGTVNYSWAFQGGTNGSGAVTAILAAPYKAIDTSFGAEGFWVGSAVVNNSGDLQNTAICRIQENTSQIIFIPTGGITVMQYDNFGVADNNVFGSISYTAFGRSY